MVMLPCKLPLIVIVAQWKLSRVSQSCYSSGGSRGGLLGSDEPHSGRVWWLKTLELHGCIKIVQLEIFSLRFHRSYT